MLTWRVRDLRQWPKIQRFTSKLFPSDDFAVAGFWVDECECVAMRYGKELDNLSKSVDAKHGIAGPGEVKWVLGMLPFKGYRHTVSFHARSRQGAKDPPRIYTNQGYVSGSPHEVPVLRSARAEFSRHRFILVVSTYARLVARGCVGICFISSALAAPRNGFHFRGLGLGLLI